MQPRLTAQITCATSAATSASEVVPFGVLTMAVSSQAGRASGHALLKEGGTACPVRVALEEDGTALHGPHEGRLDARVQVVADEVELGLAPLGKEDLVGAADGDLVAGRLDMDRALGHDGVTIPASGGAR